MTQGRKRRVILIGILVALLAAVWGYLAYTGRQSEDLGYLVKKNRYEREYAAEYEPEYRIGFGPEYQAGYEKHLEKKHGGESDFPDLMMSGMKDEEGKERHG